MRRGPVIPSATYRLQLQPEFGFTAAADLSGYLARLGISHAYSSPYLQAAPGSVHGYDVVDPHKVNVELGGSRGHRRYSAALGAAGLGQVLDIVPNHMAIPGGANPWWWDVLENGQSSRYADYFDVDWDPPEARDRNLVLLPILGDHYGRVLEAGELRIEREGGTFRLRYHDHLLPLSPRSFVALLAPAASRARSAELAFLAESHGLLPSSTATDRESVMRRHRDKDVLRRILTRVLDEQPRASAAVDDVVAATNAEPDALDAILVRQNYRLAYWRAAGRDLGYRRFFDVTSLIGLRVEDPVVFEDTHALITRWISRGVLDGIRVDHPDGLHDPATYLRRLRRALRRGWIVVEKILAEGESLPSDWPVDGTTGYDFMRDVTGLWVDPQAEAPLSALHARVVGEEADFAAVSRESRHVIVRDVLGSELNRLTAVFLAICEANRRFRDFTRHELHEALREVAVSMPVYRTYARPEDGHIAERDVAIIEEAVDVARAARPDIDPELFGFLADILTLETRGDAERDLVARFQQFTGAVMAKGVEDTAFYRYLRLAGLNDVGGEPGHFGSSIARFHAANLERAERWPASMLTTSTHDTKRAEDVRARMVAISGMPQRWERAAERWMALARSHWRGADFDARIVYLALQTLVGAWPIEVERLSAYLLKAAREAKLRTAWTEPDEAYEAALEGFAEGMLGDGAFRADLEAELPPFVRAGRSDALAQLLIKLSAPGVPDIYQGTELWDLSLVDPDNRRPVDFGRRDELLAELEAAVERDPLAGPGARALLARMEEGWPKLWVAYRALQLRRRRAELFGPEAGYEPLPAQGVAADHVVAFLRASTVATVVPRLPLRLTRGRLGADLLVPASRWGDTRVSLPAGRWLDELSGVEHDVSNGAGLLLADVLNRFPVALLVRQ